MSLGDPSVYLIGAGAVIVVALIKSQAILEAWGRAWARGKLRACIDATRGDKDGDEN